MMARKYVCDGNALTFKGYDMQTEQNHNENAIKLATTKKHVSVD